ncbi:MAG: polysaccharide pyruvyl transferase family protein [Cyclobacteriaceae bacterium]|nr:polysaccharide pyruvyl transferase family protein [Cyclobacteriaceae bacterium]
MQIFNSVKLNTNLLVRSLQDYVWGTVPYMGYPANSNLGDVELFNLAKKYLPFKSFSSTIPDRGRYVKLAAARHHYFLVGGGTLMFSEDILRKCEIMIQNGSVPIFMGTGVGDLPKNESLVNRWINILKQSPVRAVRGTYSFETLKKLGVESSICGDLGYLLNLEFETPVPDQGYIVIVPRSIRPSAYHLFSEDFEIRKKLEVLIDNLLSKGIKVIVYAVSEDDYPVTRGWIASRKSLVEYREYANNFNEFNRVLSQARVLVSMRMHPGIFSLSMGVLPIELDNRVKYTDSFSLFNNDGGLKMVDLIDPSSIAATALVDRVLEQYQAENQETRRNRFDAVRPVAVKQKEFCESLMRYAK